MRFKERLTNFFASVYTNNSKYNSSYLVNLRLLFERNNKLKSTFDKLGNTFRNSKWNDFKVQNVKISLIKSWFVSFVLIFISLLVVFSFFGYTNSTKTFFLPAFASELCGAFFFLLAQISNTFSLLLIKVGFLLLSIKISVYQFLGFNTDFVINSFKPNNLDLEHNKNVIIARKKTNNFSLTPNLTYNNELVELSRTLSQAAYALRKLEDSKSVQNLLESLQKPIKMHIDFLLFDLISLDYSESGSWRPRQVYNNILNYQPNLNFDNKSISINLNNLNELSKSNYNNVLSNFNVFLNLNQSKQNRWLLKNSLLSNSMSLNFFHFTQAKALVGNSLYSSEGTSSNVWNSSKLSQLSSINELKTLSFFKSNSFSTLNQYNSDILKMTQNSPNTIHNFNLFEESQFWNIKKYFYTTQLKSNILHLSNLNFNELSDLNNNTSNKSKLQLLLNQHLNSLPSQILPFYNSSPTVVFDKKLYTPKNLDTNNMLLEGYEFDHLKLFNSNFLISLTTSNSSNELSVHNLSSSSTNLSLLNKSLKFKL